MFLPIIGTVNTAPYLQWQEVGHTYQVSSRSLSHGAPGCMHRVTAQCQNDGSSRSLSLVHASCNSTRNNSGSSRNRLYGACIVPHTRHFDSNWGISCGNVYAVPHKRHSNRSLPYRIKSTSSTWHCTYMHRATTRRHYHSNKSFQYRTYTHRTTNARHFHSNKSARYFIRCMHRSSITRRASRFVVYL